MIDLRSDLMAPRSDLMAEAVAAALARPPSMTCGEDADEQALAEFLQAELGVEAVLLVPTCTMANQIAIRLHLPQGGRLASAPLAHIVTVEAPATALTGCTIEPLGVEAGHPTPEAIDALATRAGADPPTLVWLENTQMLAAGSVLPAGWQARMSATCRGAGFGLHLDGSRLWNAAVAQHCTMHELVAGADTVSVSLNKAVGAPLGAILGGSKAVIDKAVGWRAALGGEWRPIGLIAAAARVALTDWRGRLETDAAVTRELARALSERLGPAAVQPAPTNLIFLNRPQGDAVRFVEALGRKAVGSIPVGSSVVRLAIHCGVRERDIAAVVSAVTDAAAEMDVEP